MKRRDFIKKLGTGLAGVAIAPTLFIGARPKGVLVVKSYNTLEEIERLARYMKEAQEQGEWKKPIILSTPVHVMDAAELSYYESRWLREGRPGSQDVRLGQGCTLVREEDGHTYVVRREEA